MEQKDNATFQLSEEAKEARRAYYREYRAKNRDRIRRKAIERWERIAADHASQISSTETEANQK